MAERPLVKGRFRIGFALVTVFLIWATVHAAGVRAEGLVLPSDYRVVGAFHGFDGAWQAAAGFRLPPVNRLRSDYVELAVGAIVTTSESRPFVSIGPVWHFPVRGRWYVQFGISPTLLAGSTFGDEDLGGVIHFSSSASVGATFGKRHRLSVELRLQHISNGGLNETNPGMDLVGLTFSLQPSGR